MMMMMMKAQRDGRPAIRWMGWKLLLQSGHGIKYECGIIQANATA